MIRLWHSCGNGKKVCYMFVCFFSVNIFSPYDLFEQEVHAQTRCSERLWLTELLGQKTRLFYKPNRLQKGSVLLPQGRLQWIGGAKPARNASCFLQYFLTVLPGVLYNWNTELYFIIAMLCITTLFLPSVQQDDVVLHGWFTLMCKQTTLLDEQWN